MAWIARYLYNVTRPSKRDVSGGIDGITSKLDYQPSVDDVVAVKEALYRKSKIPYEIVDDIVDLAEYWPHTTTTTTTFTRLPETPISLNSARFGGRHAHRLTRPLPQISDKLILRSFPLGYVPSPRGNDQEGSYTLKDPDIYTVATPIPWQEPGQISDNEIKQVLSTWTSKSLSKGEYPCRKIVFTIRSHDQGFGGQNGEKGRYEGSYSWFEAGFERMTAFRKSRLEMPLHPEPIPNDTAKAHEKSHIVNDTPLPQFELLHNYSSSAEQSDPVICSPRTFIPSIEPKENSMSSTTFQHELLPSQKRTIQKNVVASGDFKQHIITWHCNDSVLPDSLEAAELGRQGRGRDTADGEFVRKMKVGDAVTVWAKVRFPAWLNFSDQVKIDVYWAV